MRLIWTGIVTGTLVGLASSADAQGGWQPQASPAPSPPPVYVSPPAPPPAPRPSKERPAMPTGNPGGWVTSEDYPPEALRSGVEGTTGFRLTIDAAGTVVGCDITASSGSQALDETACRLMTERAKFTPALDAKGKPTSGTWSSRFRWVIPEPPKPIEPYTETQSAIIETDGSATECTATRNGAPVQIEDKKNPCGKGQVVEPYTDAQGKPVRRRITMTVSLTVVDPDAPPPSPAPAAPPPKPKRRTKP